MKEVRAVEVRAEGMPEAKERPRAKGRGARASRTLPDWPALALTCLAPGERVVAMPGKGQPEVEQRARATEWELEVVSTRGYRLPFSETERQVAVFARAGQGLQGERLEPRPPARPRLPPPLGP